MTNQLNLTMLLFKAGVRNILVSEDRPKDEILLQFKTKFWELFNSIQRLRAEDIFAREFNFELTERLRIKDYPYKNDEDAEEILNVWAYHEAKILME